MEPAEILKDIKPGNSLDVMLRSVVQHHIHLTALADQKANIIIAATSIIFTVSLSNLDSITLFWPVASLCCFSLVSLILAILAVSPLYQKKHRSPNLKFDFNPLFFGHFSDLSLDEYYAEMAKIMKSETDMYAAIIKDLHQIGKVLKHKKYFYLSLSYRFFFFGLLISGALFIAQFIVNAISK